jgi:DNA-binding response OmpR family regulator
VPVPETGRILVVDDTPANIKLLDAVLGSQGYTVIPAVSGAEALALVEQEPPDLVLLDILMPGMDGYEVCRRLRGRPATAHLPVILITASETKDKVKGLDAGADDFLAKPFDQAELLARVRSLLRVKRYHDIIERQAGRLRRFLSPQLVELIESSTDDSALTSHRRKVAVLFCDLRGSTAFSEATEPEEFMAALSEFHAVTGDLVTEFNATVGHFAGDGFMVFFNDPVPCDNPAESAVRLAVAMRDAMGTVKQRWARLGHEVGFGVGIALGYATLGEVGFQARRDYTAIGRVVALASRLCDEASDGEILVSPQVQDAAEGVMKSERLAELTLKGFHKPIAPYNVLGLVEDQLDS